MNRLIIKNMQNKYPTLYIAAVILFLIYILWAAFPNTDMGTSNLLFKLLFITPFILLIIYYQLNRKKNEECRRVIGWFGVEQ